MVTTHRKNCQNCGAIRRTKQDTTCEICGSVIIENLDPSKLQWTTNPLEAIFDEQGGRMIACVDYENADPIVYYYKQQTAVA